MTAIKNATAAILVETSFVFMSVLKPTIELKIKTIIVEATIIITSEIQSIIIFFISHFIK